MRQYRNEGEFNRLEVAFWIVEIFQFVLAVIIVGITGSASKSFLNELNYVRIPDKLVLVTFQEINL
jgi:hypothetical protein